MIHARLLCVFLPVVLACSAKVASDGKGCASAEDCGAGEVCREHDCVRLCVSDEQCPDGVCNGDICVAGQRSPPTLGVIDGDGATLCAATPGAHCVGTGLLVTG